jgi:sugar/nucleoside kinase (ribokinase family)
VALGEVLVDIFAEDPAREEGGERRAAPRFGGSPANIAVGAARFGARSAFLGSAGDDRWGRWLERILRSEGVDLAGFNLLQGVETPSARVMVSAAGEPSFRFHGDREECVVAAAGRVEEALVGPPGVFVFGSDTLIGKRERGVTLGAQRLARERGWTVLYDPNLRPARWPGERAMLRAASAALANATIVKANRAEAMALTGTRDAASAGAAMLGAGAAVAIITLGAGGALLSSSGRDPLRVPAPRAEVVDATGAGDALAAVIAAALAAGADLGDLGRALELAVAVAARVVGASGALAGLPSAEAARESLRRVLGSG